MMSASNESIEIKRGFSMATMKEIAELSGVSRGTVDRVLNHRALSTPRQNGKF